MNEKRISAAALVALREALTHLYWYKNDLRRFLTAVLSGSPVLGQVNWDDFKRNIVGEVVDYLERREDRHQDQLVRLMTEVAYVEDFSHLERLDDGPKKARVARQAVAALRRLVHGHAKIVEEVARVEERRERARELAARRTAVRHRLAELRAEFVALVQEANAQARGFKLEKVVRGLFEVFDLDPRASFRVVGEQIDGAFTFDSTEYLLEAKWQEEPVKAADLYVLEGRVGRKLDNTLGLFLSVNGYSTDCLAAAPTGRRMTMLLMDGAELTSVLEGRIELPELLRQKRRAAGHEGDFDPDAS